jgi:predicted nuclease of restriction endonuclease-like RecB superfamily
VRVRITAWGNTRALVRHARRLGLICVVRATSEPGVGEPVPDTLELELSGPFTLFRHTELYGRELATLVPRAAWCHRFELVANCALGRGRVTSELVVRSGDPIAPAAEPPLDSRLEERFQREFARAARGWEIVREPPPIELADSMLFPDFELVHRRDPSRRWLLEIAGFWTRESVESKLKSLREANLERLVLCIDERRKCSDSDLPPDAKIIRYRTRIDPAAVLAVIGT